MTGVGEKTTGTDPIERQPYEFCHGSPPAIQGTSTASMPANGQTRRLPVALVTRFEDLEAWRQSRMLVRDIYAVTNYPRFSRDYGLRDQIRRAAVSIMSNIAEGFER